jgi:3-carboxy-cis,cis-muconate cycloisomerase
MTDSVPTLLGPLFGSAAMCAIVNDGARLQRMLDFELALVRAEASIGVVPALAVDPIVRACQAAHYDIAALAQAAAPAGNIAIAVVEALTAEVAKTSEEAAGFVHWGATSQDVIDTALVLELRAAIDALIADLDRAIDGFAALSGRHRRTPFVARTLMQHALPMPFGLKLAGYAAAISSMRSRWLCHGASGNGRSSSAAVRCTISKPCSPSAASVPAAPPNWISSASRRSRRSRSRERPSAAA